MILRVASFAVIIAFCVGIVTALILALGSDGEKLDE